MNLTYSDSLCYLELDPDWHNNAENLSYLADNLLPLLSNKQDVKAVLIAFLATNTNNSHKINGLDSNKALEILKILAGIELPTIAVLAGGVSLPDFALSLACHYRFIDENAIVDISTINQDFIDDIGKSISFVSQNLLCALSKQIRSARSLNTDQLLTLGLPCSIVEPGTTAIAASRFASNLVGQKGQTLIKRAVQSILNSQRLEYSAALREETRIFIACAQDAAASKAESL